MAQYDALHFFLDESGQFRPQDRRDQLDFVGGVLLFGPYDASADDSLRDILRHRLTDAGGVFPRDLHFGTSATTLPMEEILRNIATDLRIWCGEKRAVYGISLLHAEDLFAGNHGVLSERQSDYRYLSMLWTLVEHLVFVDAGVAERLIPGASLNLCVANRAYFFDPAVEPREYIEGLGYTVQPDRRHPGMLVVPNILDERDLLTMLRMALRQRWQQASVTLGEIRVPRIDYEHGRSPAALYLADLYLGLVRLAELAARRHFRPHVRSVLLPAFRKLSYGPWLDLLARMQSALNARDADAWLRIAEEYDIVQGDPSAYQSVLARQEKAAAELLSTEPQRLEAFLETACQMVDMPGFTSSGLRKAERGIRLLRSQATHSLRAEVLVLQAQLAYANHTGQVDLANGVWEEYLKREPDLVTLGLEGLRLKAEMVNRRAVNLTDRFLYADAEQVLAGVSTIQQALQTVMQNTATPGTGQIPNRELGACYGTLGQVHAFQGDPARSASAEIAFRKACAFFNSPEDIERQWVYLGHLACDRGSTGRTLWDEVQRHLPGLSGSTPLCGPEQQYLLALQLKGWLIFGTPKDILDFLGQWEQNRPIEQFSPDEVCFHPFGLIYQALALIYARAWRETKRTNYRDRALECYDAAAQHMNEHGPLLQALARFAELRRDLFELEMSPGSVRSLNQLSNHYLSLRGHLAKHFGAAAWSEDASGRPDGYFGRGDPGVGTSLPDRVRRVLEGVRFNYW